MSSSVVEETAPAAFAEAAARTEAQTDAPLVTTAEPTPANGETIEEKAQKLAGQYGLTPVEYKVLQQTTCKGAPYEIAAWFMLFCKRRNLDPFAKEVYLWNDKQDGSGQWQVVTSIGGLRVIASRSPYYRGQLKPTWTFVQDPNESDGIARFTKHESKYGKIEGKRVPEECEVVVRRAIPQAPTDSSLYLEFYGIARFDEFVKTDFNSKVFGNWEAQPEHQLRIRTEAMALRMAFPEEVGGIYLEEEMRDRQDDAMPPAAPGTPAAVEREPIDDEIDAVAKDLNFTKARVRIEADKAGGGKDGLLEALIAIRAARDAQGPKGGTKGAPGDTIPPVREPEALEGETVEPPVAAAAVEPEPEPTPTPAPAPKRRRGQPDDSNEPLVEKALCNACGAKKGQPHSVNCPIDETDEVPA